MNDYYEVRVDMEPCLEDATDLLAAILGDAGFESFVPDDKGLTAYAKAEEYSAEAVKQAIDGFPYPCAMSMHATLIPGKDWNEEWEKNYFQPIAVDGENGEKVVIHSSFHTDVPEAAYDIVIDPKMAFGTGHHATTSQIISQLLAMPLAGKSVVDMGTGTGILAILAAMRGARAVAGVEIDAFAYENARENAILNGHPEIRLVHGDASSLASLGFLADVFIANINRNIITADIDKYAPALKHGGLMILSGFYEHDIPVVCDKAEEHGLRFLRATSMAGEEKKEISKRPASDPSAPDSPQTLRGTYGAVESAGPEAPWACLILKKD